MDEEIFFRSARITSTGSRPLLSPPFIAACGGTIRRKTIAVFGLTFKPETDDMRDAPSIPIIARLVQDGATVRAFDPRGMDQAKPLLPSDVVYCRDALDAATEADALVLTT